MVDKVTIAQLENLAKKFIINPASGCWEWQAAMTGVGYGSVEINYKHTSAHKWVYALANGYWPSSKMALDHLCRNRRCVNPKHLELVSFRTNILRGIGIAAQNSKKTHCKNGHEYTPENTYNRVRPNKLPERDCKTCRNTALIRFNKKARIAS